MHHRAKLGVAIRTGAPQAVQDNIRREMHAAMLEDHVRKILALTPPLTPEQRERIASLLKSAS
ncbi:hypothetical protein [Georgenia sp. AZ-5]|uniref:hypothetical protein n=1 Tax=Georgenia sp. AZ-5 TaxID=3367526 RepID=UPI00375521C6